MGIFITYDKEAVKKIVKNLVDTRDRINNMKTPLMRISEVIYQSIMQNFSEEGTDKEKWKELSPLTIALRRKGKGEGKPKILQDTGYLRANIIPNATDEYATVGTNVGYGFIHQFGGVSSPWILHTKAHIRTQTMAWGRPMIPKKVKVKKHDKHMPESVIQARPFLYIRRLHMERIRKIASDWVFKGQ